MQKRYKSKVLWLAIAALLGFILKQWNLFDAIGLNMDSYNTLVDLILAVAIAAGVINNPTDKERL